MIDLKLQNSLSSYCSKLNTSSLLLNACTLGWKGVSYLQVLQKEGKHSLNICSEGCYHLPPTWRCKSFREGMDILSETTENQQNKLYLGRLLGEGEGRGKTKQMKGSKHCERIKGEGEKVKGKRKQTERGREDDCQAGVFLFAITHVHTPQCVSVFMSEKKDCQY